MPPTEECLVQEGQDARGQAGSLDAALSPLQRVLVFPILDGLFL